MYLPASRGSDNLVASPFRTQVGSFLDRATVEALPGSVPNASQESRRNLALGGHGATVLKGMVRCFSFLSC